MDTGTETNRDAFVRAWTSAMRDLDAAVERDRLYLQLEAEWLAMWNKRHHDSHDPGDEDPVQR